MNNNKAGTYALGRDIDAGITSTWNSGARFQPIGAGNSFTGNLDGQGHTISGLFINRPADQNVGLISYLAAGASVSNVGVIGATITGHTTVGGIVGNNYGAVSKCLLERIGHRHQCRCRRSRRYNFRSCRWLLERA